MIAPSIGDRLSITVGIEIYAFERSGFNTRAEIAINPMAIAKISLKIPEKIAPIFAVFSSFAERSLEYISGPIIWGINIIKKIEAALIKPMLLLTGKERVVDDKLLISGKAFKKSNGAAIRHIPIIIIKNWIISVYTTAYCPPIMV
jgi:hypothetical protein